LLPRRQCALHLKIRDGAGSGPTSSLHRTAPDGSVWRKRQEGASSVVPAVDGSAARRRRDDAGVRPDRSAHFVVQWRTKPKIERSRPHRRPAGASGYPARSPPRRLSLAPKRGCHTCARAADANVVTLRRAVQAVCCGFTGASGLRRRQRSHPMFARCARHTATSRVDTASAARWSRLCCRRSAPRYYIHAPQVDGDLLLVGHSHVPPRRDRSAPPLPRPVTYNVAVPADMDLDPPRSVCGRAIAIVYPSPFMKCVDADA
jgi:hypothetical protein